MVTGVSADGDRRQRLQCKSHIHKSARRLAVVRAKYQSQESSGFFLGAAKQRQRGKLSSSPADVWLARARDGRVCVFGGVGLGVSDPY